MTRLFETVPLEVNPCVDFTSKYGIHRKRLLELSISSPDPKEFEVLNKRERQRARVKQRNRSHLLKNWKQCFWYELEDKEDDFPRDYTKDFCYFVDNRDGAFYDKDPGVDDICFPLSGVDKIDKLDPCHEGRNIIVKTADGRIVCIMLNQESRGRISVGKWRRFLKALQRAVKTQYNNPRGIRKAGCYVRYVLFGWR